MESCRRDCSSNCAPHHVSHTFHLLIKKNILMSWEFVACIFLIAALLI